jgi:hypothetical protein
VKPSAPIDARQLRPRLYASTVVPLTPEEEFVDWEVDWLPDVVRNWVEAQSDAYAVPRVMPIAAAMSAIATILQGKVWVEAKPGRKPEPLSVYWLMCSPTGTMKSLVLDAAKAPIKAIESAAVELAKEQAKVNRRTRAMLEGRIKKLRSMHASKGSLSDDQKNELTSSDEELYKLPVEKSAKWFYSNINPSLIPRKMADNEEAEGIPRIAVMADEDTFLRNMMGRHSGHADLEVVMSGYTGGAVEMTRKSVSSDATVDVRLDECYLTMLVMTQPHVLDWMRSNSVLADQGFWGRTIVTLLPRRPLPPDDAPPVPEHVTAAWNRLIERLHAHRGPTVLKVPGSAWGERGALRALSADARQDTDSGDGGEGYAVRAVGRVARFWALAEMARLMSDDVSCQEASGPPGPRHEGIKINYLVHPLYYQGVTQAQALQPPTATLDGATHRALAWLRRQNGLTMGAEVTLRQLMRALTLNKSVVSAALDELIEHGYLEPGRQIANKGGKTTLTYRVIALHAEPELRSVPQPPVES